MKQGLAYEHRVAKYLQLELNDTHEILHGQWILYDTKYCQPDLICIPFKKGVPILLIEVKLTFTPHAEYKLHTLYLPLVRKLYPFRRFLTLQICKNLIPQVNPGPLLHIDDIPHNVKGLYNVIHFLS